MRHDGLKILWLGAIGLGLFLQGCSTTGDSRAPSETAAESSREQVVTTALSEIGTRYRYGAQLPGKALDCSALTRYAYSAAGVVIPRISTDQRRSATPVRLAKVQPGDLVFFKIRRGVSHVGLMVDGKRFVHASVSKKRVRLSSIDSDYWQQRLVGAGTFLN